jgi:uncharacterized protein YjiS (DUF1127 family)
VSIYRKFTQLMWRINSGGCGVVIVLRRWRELARQRRQLAMLSDMALKDLGLSRADIMQESDRPFWHDPLKR